MIIKWLEKSPKLLWKMAVLRRSMRGVSVDVVPKIALQDVRSKISASGITPFAPVTLRAEWVNERGRLFRSCAHFEADTKGEVDCSRHPSLGGSYKGCYPMALITGLSSTEKKYKHLRMHRSDTTIPFNIKISMHEGHITAQDDVESLACMQIERHLCLPEVTRVPVREGVVRGILYLPPGPGPHPGIVDIYGGAGGLMDFRSAIQASRGIASLSLAYFGYDDLPFQVSHFELEMFEEAVNILTSHHDVIPDRCGIWASCYGAAFGLIMAEHIDKVTAIVTVNGTVIPYSTKVTYKGKTVVDSKICLASKHFNFDDNLIASLNLDKLQEWLSCKENIVPISKVSPDKKYMMVVTGNCLLGGVFHANAFKNIAQKNGNNNVEILSYDVGGHIIEPPYSAFNSHVHNPYWPDNEGGPELPTAGISIANGGSVEENYEVMEDMWPKVLRFYHTHIKDNSSWYQNHLHTTANVSKL